VSVQCLTWEGTEVGGDQLGAKHGGEEDMWVDVGVQGSSMERRICKRLMSRDWGFFINSGGGVNGG